MIIRTSVIKRFLGRFVARNGKKAGYTLVELLIFMALLAGILVVVSDILGSVLDVRLESESTSSVEQDGKYILNRIGYDIGRADEITVPANDGDNSASLILVIGPSSNSYSLNGGNLQLTNLSGTNRLNSISTSISNLSFTRIGNSADAKDTIRMSFTVTSTTVRVSGPEVRSYQTTVGLR